MVASSCFIYIAFSSFWYNEVPSYLYYVMLGIIMGLVFSWFGDLFLLSRAHVTFLLGLISFFLAHICYIIAFILVGVDWFLTISALVVFTVPGIAIALWLRPSLGSMRFPVYAYMLAISCMIALATGAWAYSGLWNLPLGALLFYLSDIFVARDRFKKSDKWNVLIGILYYAGQVFLASTLIWFN
ncbi:MAG TPA: lysoplasmalogenase [Candidatus Hydrogenedens sp.]|nr:lysoplasmalogenase [Candidatus Hydrogenedens sp.]